MSVTQEFIDFLDQFPHTILDKKRSLNNVGCACIRSLEAIGNSNSFAQESLLKILMKNVSIEIANYDDEAFKKKLEMQVESACKVLIKMKSWQVLNQCRLKIANCISDITVNLKLLWFQVERQNSEQNRIEAVQALKKRVHSIKGLKEK